MPATMAPHKYEICCTPIDVLLSCAERVPEGKKRATKLRKDLHEFLGAFDTIV